MPLCDRCGEEIALANDFDQARDIDRRRRVVFVADKPRRLTPTFWRLFTLLYRHRGDVMENDRLYAELYGDMEQPMAAKAVREAVRRLRKVLAGSRYKIIDHPTLGYELIVRDDRRRTKEENPPRSGTRDATFSPSRQFLYCVNWLGSLRMISGRPR